MKRHTMTDPYIVAIIKRLTATHPLRYAYTAHDECIYDDQIDRHNGRVIDIMARCPVCEQWSPCDVRRLITQFELLATK